MHVASLMRQSLDIDDHNAQLIRLVALLHDVGHAPFSHTLEMAFNIARAFQFVTISFFGR